MNRNSFILLIVLMSWASAAHAQQPKALGDNAALVYWQAMALLPEFKDADRKALDEFGAVAPADPAAASVVAQTKTVLRLTRRGAAIADCDWGLRISEDGPDAMLPHLNKLRELARVLLLNARVECSAGQRQQGIDDILATIRMARHAGQDQLLIGALVEYGIESLAHETLAAQLPSIPKDELDGLAKSLAKLPARSTIGAAIRVEGKSFGGWLVRRIETGENVARTLAPMLGSDTKTTLEMALTGRETFKKWGAELMACYEKTARIMELPYPQHDKALEVLADEIKNSPNLLIRLVMPAVSRARWSQTRMEIQEQMLHSAIAFLSGGPEKSATIKDPSSDKPFARREIESGFELLSEFKGRDGKALAMKFPKPAAAK